MSTVYLLSGLLCDREVWADQAQTLSQQHDVHIVSFEGFDAIEAMARQVLDKAPSRFALAGHSMGGRVALEVYRQAPDRIERLALLDTGYGGVAPSEFESRGALVQKAKEEGIGAIADAWGRPMVAPCNHPQVLGRVLAMVNRMSPEIFAGQTQALLSRPDATALLADIACPTLLLCGEQDGWSPPERHERMAAMIRGSKLVTIPECGHMSPMERPAEVLQALEAWLALPPVSS